MLNKANTLTGYALESLDGDIGKVKEFFFDDQHWTVRYLVADTGNWLTGKQVLLSPYALGAVIKEKRHIVVKLTKKQIEESPSLNSDKPVSRVFEEAYHGYYGWPVYWEGPYMWGAYPYIMREMTEGLAPAEEKKEKAWDPHLRSSYDVTGYHIQAADGVIGHVADFIIDDETWAIRYLIVDTRNWWRGKKVLLSPQWIERVSWEDAKVFVNLTRETIKLSPQYTEDGLLTRDYEDELHRHYNRQGYWADEVSDREQ
jgi:hypothetical protein